MNLTNRGIYILVFIAVSLLWIKPNSAYSQTEVDERAVISFDKGLGFFDPDSIFGFNLRFRMQNRIGMNTLSGDNLRPDQFEANVRRLRLRFDGFIGKSGLTYYLQLSFSRGDQDWDASGFPGIVRDAMVFYTFSENFYIGMGQGKLPGNRQRVVSSGQQQFADRSLANAIFNIDRDFGLMGYYSNHLGGFHFNLKGAVSSGEGRNIQRTDSGLAYTSRIELLPLGTFSNDGDFSEGDLMREPTPKLSVGLSHSLNQNAIRSAGQRGAFLAIPVNITSLFADIILKYNGWALQSEYAQRDVSHHLNLVANEGETPVYVFSGLGMNSQISYVFPNMIELAGRYTYVKPGREYAHLDAIHHIYTLGMTKYLPNHRNKFQVNVSYNDNTWPNKESSNHWNVMLQFELGI